MPYSRDFIHRSGNNPYDQLQQCPSTGTEVCKTSFREHQVRNYLNINSTANRFKIYEDQLSGKKYFVMQAMLNNTVLGNPLFGDLPCPKDCIPPDKENLDLSFDRSHVLEVIDSSQCLWLQVHSSRFGEGGVYNKYSIYALSDDGSGGLVNEWNNEDKMFTTI